MTALTLDWPWSLALLVLIGSVIGIAYLGHADRRQFVLRRPTVYWLLPALALLGSVAAVGWEWGKSFEGTILSATSRRELRLEVRTAEGVRSISVDSAYQGSCPVGVRLQKPARSFTVYCEGRPAPMPWWSPLLAFVGLIAFATAFVNWRKHRAGEAS